MHRQKRTYGLGAGAACRRRGAHAPGRAGDVDGCGGRKKGEGERGEDGEAGEHLDAERQRTLECGLLG